MVRSCHYRARERPILSLSFPSLRARALPLSFTSDPDLLGPTSELEKTQFNSIFSELRSRSFSASSASRRSAADGVALRLLLHERGGAPTASLRPHTPTTGLVLFVVDPNPSRSELEAEGGAFRAIQGSWASDAIVSGNAFNMQHAQSSGMECEPTLQIGYHQFVPPEATIPRTTGGENNFMLGWVL
uniref:Uncharacterized protein n=1 Tax=Ananas comosus var. bracteatus TaxID=296719 RepID=A0A6V7NED1_ANACO|nr:unnamed protein product [Ananas comosus var. bracteatus]